MSKYIKRLAYFRMRSSGQDVKPSPSCSLRLQSEEELSESGGEIAGPDSTVVGPEGRASGAGAGSADPPD